MNEINKVYKEVKNISPNNSQNYLICNWCGIPSKIVWVHGHGHGQYSNCGINLEECCKGEVCQPQNNSENENLSDIKSKK